jgi:tetratricopeptide (TPR) repeat protein
MSRSGSAKLSHVSCLAVAAFLACGGPIASAHNGLAEKIAVLSAQIARDPASADLLVRRADAYREVRQWTNALSDLDRAERIDSSLSTPDFVRARIFLERQEWQRAVAAATRFLTRQPRHADALIVRARAQSELGQWSASAADFSAALRGRPNPDIYIERARALAQVQPGGPARAVASLDEGISALGTLVTLELEAVDLELRLHRFDAALARVDRASAQSPRKESWLARRGAILERAGRRDEARAAYAAALAAAAHLPDRIQRTRASTTLIAELRADIERLDRSR